MAKETKVTEAKKETPAQAPAKNEQPATTPAAPAQTEAPTSEALTEIRAKIDAKLDEQAQAIAAKDRQKQLDINLEIYKLQNDEKAELSNIARVKAQAEAQEKINAKVSLVDNLINAVMIAAGVKFTDEQRAQFAGERDAVVNEVIPAQTQARAAGAKRTTGAPKGEEGQQIIDLYLQGKTHKEIEELGHKRSTVWHSINNYKKSLEAPAA